MSKISEMVSSAADVIVVCAVTAVALFVASVVVFNIASTAPADPVWEELRCVVGISFKGDEQCFKKRVSSEIEKVSEGFKQRMQELEKAYEGRKRELDTTIRKQREQVAALEARRASLEQEKASIDQERGGLASKLKKLEEIEKSSTSFSLFTDKEWKRGLSVTTGVEYRSFVRSQEWTKAWCYVHFTSGGGVLSRLALGDQQAGGAIEYVNPSAAVLAAGNFSAQDVAEAKLLCSFPGKVLNR